MIKNQHILEIIYSYIPVSEDDDIMNALYNIFQSADDLDETEDFTVSKFIKLAHFGDGNHLYLSCCMHKNTTWPYVSDISLHMYSPVCDFYFRDIETRLDLTETCRLVASGVRQFIELWPRVYELVVDNTSLRSKSIKWKMSEVYSISKYDFLAAAGHDVQMPGLNQFLRKHGLSNSILEMLLSRDFYRPNIVPRVPAFCMQSGNVLKRYIRKYVKYPFTLESVKDVLKSLKQKPFSRQFAKQWCQNAEPYHYHYLKQGKIGYGNGAFALLTHEGFFNILRNRMKSEKQRNAISELSDFYSYTKRKHHSKKQYKKECEQRIQDARKTSFRRH